MKRILYLFSTIAVMLLLCSPLEAQSLGDAARELRKEKRPQAKRVITNEEIRSAGQTSAPAAPASTEKPAEPAADKDKDKDKGKPAVTAEEVAKLNAEWRAKVNDQKKVISQLEREIDVAQREYKLRAAVYYADAGNALRDSKKWAEDERKYQADMADKQKQLSDARQKLDQLQEDARKAGAKVE